MNSLFELNKVNNFQQLEQTIENCLLQDKHPLVLMNISDVCFEHTFTVQSGAYRKLVAERIKETLPKEETKAAINKIRTLIVNNAGQQLIDTDLPSIISRIQKQVPVMGISGRSAWASYAPNENNADLVNKYLSSLNINFAESDFVSQIDPKIYREKDQPSFQHGILFTNGKPSADQIQSPPSGSTVVKNFLADINFEGKTLIIVNNSERSLKKMAGCLSEDGFDVHAIHYSADKIRVKTNPLIGDVQFLQLVEGTDVSSDEKASELWELKKNDHEGSYEAQFDQYIASRKWEQIAV